MSSESFDKSIGFSFSSKDECLSIEQEPKLDTPKSSNVGSDTDSFSGYGPSTPDILEQDLICTASSDSISILQGDEVNVNELETWSVSPSQPLELPRTNLCESQEQCSLGRHAPSILKSQPIQEDEVYDVNDPVTCSASPSSANLRESQEQCSFGWHAPAILKSQPVQEDEVDVNEPTTCSASPSQRLELPRTNLRESQEQCSLGRHAPVILKSELIETDEDLGQHDEDRWPSIVESEDSYQVDIPAASSYDLNFNHSIPFSPIKTSKTECAHPETSGGWDSDSQGNNENDSLLASRVDFSDTTPYIEEQSLDSRKERTISPFKDMTNKNNVTNAGVESPLNEAGIDANRLKSISKLDSAEEYTGRSQKQNDIRRLVDVERLAVLLSRLDSVKREMAEIDETIERAITENDHHYVSRGEFV